MVKVWCANKTKIWLRRALLHQPYYLEISRTFACDFSGLWVCPHFLFYFMTWAGLMLAYSLALSRALQFFFLASRILYLFFNVLAFLVVKIYPNFFFFNLKGKKLLPEVPFCVVGIRTHERLFHDNTFFCPGQWLSC